MKNFRLFGRSDKGASSPAPVPSAYAATSDLANIGCGARLHPSWDNYDLFPAVDGVRPLSLRERLPIGDGQYMAVYCSHVLEHLRRDEVGAALREIQRILKPGGIIRVAVPDLELIAELYLKELRAASAGEQGAQVRHEWMSLELLDQLTRTFSGGFMGRFLSEMRLPERDFIVSRVGEEASGWLPPASGEPVVAKFAEGESLYRPAARSASEEAEFGASGERHAWMYDRVSLARLLDSCGFVDIGVCAATESRIPGFPSFFLDTDESGRIRKPDSLFMEARKRQ